MSEYINPSQFESLRFFFILFLVVIGFMLMTSCSVRDMMNNSNTTTQTISGNAVVSVNSAERTPARNTDETIPYNAIYTIPIDPSLPPEKQIGTISNQIWLFGPKRSDLDLLLMKYI